MSRRRRSADFSGLLQSFRDTTDCGTDLITNAGLLTARQDIVPEKTCVDDKMSSGKRLDDKDNSGTCSYKSTILAGQTADVQSQGSTENSYRTAHSGSTSERPIAGDVSAETCRSEVPSFMNRAIDLHFVPQSDLDLSQSTEEPDTRDELNRDIETSKKLIHDSRDTNYNIKNHPEIATSSTCRPSYRRVHTPMAGKSTSDNDSAQIFKRLTQEFMSSPRRFTERLVTIIDETESGYANDDNSGVDLSRMTQEFQKMCKYIQDESMPEHMNSTVGISRHFEENKATSIRWPETIEESLIDESSQNDEARTPDAKDIARKIYRKTPLNLFKKNVRDNNEADSPGSPNSTRHFVYLEKYLSEEQPSSPNTGSSCPIVRDPLSGDISEHMKAKMRAIQKSEQQLASLDDTDNRAFETFDSHPAHGAQERDAYDLQVEIDVHENFIEDRAIDADDLSMSLRLELEKQRERCFETARQMQKIEEDAIECNEDYTKVLERCGIDLENECRKTINSLLTYQICRSRIRQNDRVRKNEVSSIDSGIDTRSISRTLLHASSKKSCNNEASLRGAAKNSEISTKFPRSVSTPVSSRSNGLRSGSAIGRTNSELRPAATSVMHPMSSKKFVAARRRSPGNMCPTAKALGRSRSRCGEKLSLPRPIETTIRTPGKNRINENRKNMLSPKVVVDRLEIPNGESTPVSSNNVQASSGRNGRATPGRMKSPCSRYRVPSPRASPTVRQSSKDQTAKTVTLGRMESPALTRTAKSPKNRFFVTPGKTVPIRETKRRSKQFFPSLNVDLQLEGPQRIIKSPHAPGIYRRGMCTVISPLSMYIRGTDTNLIQNVQAGTNEMLLTPTKATASAEKLKFQLAAKMSTPLNSPCRATPFTREKVSESQSDDNDENTREPDSALPKVSYALPARVHTVDKSPRNIGGARFRGLLQSVENRVVVGHEGRIFRRCDKGNVPESDNDPPDLSIHVQRSAKKTNYLMNGRK